MLKNCPEIAYFLSEGITYLSFKKEQDAEFAEESSKRGTLSFSFMRSLFNSWKSLTSSDSSGVEELLDRYQLRELMDREAGINSSVAFLERLLQYRTKSNQLKSDLLKN